jgi:UDP-glucose-4-epimerase GalE
LAIKESSNRLKILVTGGAGYIGSHTAKLLACVGMEPVVLDNLSNGHRKAVRWGSFEEGDLADRDFLQRVFEAHKFDGVIHFAAHAYVGESVSNPRKYFRNNVVNTLNLLDVMQDHGVNHLVFSSSCAVYGIPDSVPIGEGLSLKPVNPYGESKLFVERILRWYREAYGLCWIALRYFNAAGADPEGEAGEIHNPETHLIPLAIQAALGWISELEIMGTDYPTSDGTAIRDYIHVCDLASAHVRALEHLFRGGTSLALNLGTGRGYSVREVIKTVEEISGRAVPHRAGARRPGDPPTLVADPSKAAEVLQWTPRYPELGSIVETAWHWHANQSLPEPHTNQ